MIQKWKNEKQTSLLYTQKVTTINVHGVSLDIFTLSRQVIRRLTDTFQEKSLNLWF